MKGVYKIGRFSKKDAIKSYKTISREIEVKNSIGWTSMHKAHKSIKDYTRSPKHKKGYSLE
jgi:hypothetical protein